MEPAVAINTVPYAVGLTAAIIGGFATRASRLAGCPLLERPLRQAALERGAYLNGLAFIFGLVALTVSLLLCFGERFLHPY